MTRQRRQYLIDAHLPFVVQDKQIYLPFLGVSLQDCFDSKHLLNEKLQPSAQMLFLYYLYGNTTSLYMTDAVKALGFSAMTITRAMRQLVETGLFLPEKDGVQKLLVAKARGLDLYRKMKLFLINPVRKRIYVAKKATLPMMLLAGESALSELSMLNPPELRCFAIASAAAKELQGSENLLDADNQLCVEVWKYDPHLLAKKDVVDPFSLALSFLGETDERVDAAIEEILKEQGRSLDGSRI
jgi:hypothetical protein